MADPISKRLKNIFVVTKEDHDRLYNAITKAPFATSGTYGGRPDRIKLSTTNERSIISSIITRIGIDVAALDIRHVRVDEHGTYVEDIDSPLNWCLKLWPNIDQTSRPFFQDATMSLLDEGCISIPPIDTDEHDNGEFDIYSMRVGRVTTWHPRDVKIKCYNDQTGKEEDILMEKSRAAIVENPLYAIMNEPNSTAKRLAEKLALLDAADRKANSGRLDIIIQLPYVVKNQKRIDEAATRIENLQKQLEESAYGIAYADATERITQLNRPAENTLMSQIEYLTSMLYSQLGITETVFDGTADDKTMLNYHNRTIVPIIDAICESMRRSYLSEQQIKNGETIMYFRDPFATLPVTELASASDSFTRNAIMSTNEVRPKLGLKPSDQPEADELRNKNLNKSDNETTPINNSGEGAT